ncbi:hypothetical protein P7C73_g6776, partial [Tremellales sp. Uapishka_1]
LPFRAALESLAFPWEYLRDGPGATGIQDAETAMVISIECDSFSWRGIDCPGPRKLQFAQWTVMVRNPWVLETVSFVLMLKLGPQSKPYHPIMIDVLDQMTRELEKTENVLQDWTDVLGKTGPGPFTDAVFRYLLVQYGVPPEALMKLEEPVRIGDIMFVDVLFNFPLGATALMNNPSILPMHSFSQESHLAENWGSPAEDFPWGAVTHSSMGRWKPLTAASDPEA